MTNKEQSLKLHDPVAFDSRFIELSAEHKTYEEAYLAVEQEYRSVFGTTKYSNYNSFRNAYHVRRKKRENEL